MTTRGEFLVTMVVSVALLLLVGCGDGPTGSKESTDESAAALCQLPPVDRCGSWNGLSLLAKKTYSPPRSVDDQHRICRPLTFTIPPSLPVVAGDSGEHRATLNFSNEGGPTVSCSYKGTQHGGHSPHATPGKSYVLESCSDRKANGSQRTATVFTLHVDMGDQKSGDTVVTATIGDPTPPATGSDPTQQYLPADSAVAGASLSVPLGAAPVTQPFAITLDPVVPAGRDIHPGDGLWPVVTLGPAVTFAAVGATEPYHFTETTPCTTITLPYDPAILGRYPGATPGAYQLLSPDAPPAGKVPVEAISDVTVDARTHTVSFCTPHLSTYTTGINLTDPISYDTTKNGPILSNAVNVYLIWYGAWGSKPATNELPAVINALSGSAYLRTVASFVTPDGTVPTTNVRLAKQSQVASTKSSLNGGDIRDIVNQRLDDGTFPADPKAFYAVLLAKGISEGSSTEGSCTDFCGWHTSERYYLPFPFIDFTGRQIRYSVLIDPETCPPVAVPAGFTVLGEAHTGCEVIDQDATTKTIWAAAPNGDPVTNKLVDTFSHELIETITNPDSSSWHAGASASIENGDMCAWLFGTTYKAANGHLANINIASRDYLIQEELVHTEEGQYCAMARQDAALDLLTGPKRVQLGSSLRLELKFRNTGEGLWPSSGFGIKRLGVESGWVPVSDFIGLTNSVGVGEVADFQPLLVPPATLGAHPFAVRMYVNDGAVSGAKNSDKTTNAHYFGATASTSIEVVNNNAQFVSHSIPTSIRASSPGLYDSFELSLTFRNTGATPWTGNSPFVYGLLDLTGTMSTTLVSLAEGEVIQPGDTKTFTFNVTAPLSAVSGGIQSQWTVAGSDGVKMLQFGQKSPLQNIAVTPPVDFNSRFISQSVPTIMVAGQTYPVSIVFENNAPTPWSSSFDVKLRSQNPPLNTTWGLDGVPLKQNAIVQQGQTTSFDFNVIAPTTPGSYDFQWMLQFCGAIGIPCPSDYGWLGVPTDNVTVTVLASLADSANYEPNVPDVSFYCSKTPMISCYPYGLLCYGRSYSVPIPVTMTNVGGTTWTKGAGYALAVEDPGWGIDSIDLADTDAIAPGQSKTFYFNPIAPYTTGFLGIRFHMIHSGSSFGEETPAAIQEYIGGCGG